MMFSRVVPNVYVADAAAEDIVEAAVSAAINEERDAPFVVTALHVGGLNHLPDPDYEGALSDADLLHADGAAVVLLAKLAGARHIQRAATTDIGIPMIEEMRKALGRTVRVALIGGVPTLAARAGERLRDLCGCEIVHASHGYHNAKSWIEVLSALRAAEPDIVFVGLGAPKETIFVREYREHFPASLVVTCGGWYGFLAGEEHRAPRFFQILGLEWSFRLLQDPSRLAGRYFRGMATTARLAVQLAADRAKSKRRSK